MAADELDCKAVLFDLDGVLVDSTASIQRVLASWSELRSVDADELMRLSHGRRVADTLNLVAPHLDPASEVAVIDAMEVDDARTVKATPGANQLVRMIPIDAWAVVTSASRTVAKARMISAGLPLPQILISAEDVASGKPDPQGYLEAARSLGVAPSDCLVVEDAPAGIEAGQAAGIRVLAVSTTHPGAKLRTPWIVEDLRGITIESQHDPQGTIRVIVLFEGASP
jgi:sugar-phosphatase